jgi:hypothetical protein
MTDWNDLTPAEQRQLVAEQMRIARGHDWMVRCHTVEALALSRELLAVPVYRWPNREAVGAHDEQQALDLGRQNRGCSIPRCTK